MPSDPRLSRVSENSDKLNTGYRPISGWAITGLVLGLISLLALAGPVLWILPLAAGAVCLRALIHVWRNAPAMMGRKAALAGLWLAGFSFSAAYGDWLYFRRLMRIEARRTAAYWFDLLARNRPELAYQLTLSPQHRHPFDERIWDYYVDYEESKPFTALKKYVAPSNDGNPPNLVRTLLALGDSADARCYRTLDQQFYGPQYFVDQLFAVTYPESGGKKTFFVSIRLMRAVETDQTSFWRVVSAQGGVDENGLKPSDAPAD
jgi:hypothetical protein